MVFAQRGSARAVWLRQYGQRYQHGEYRVIGLMYLAGLGIWLTVAIMLSRRIPGWLGAIKHQGILSVLLLPLVLVAPFADEVIGRWQYYGLCDKEAVVTLSPDWQKVTRAQEKEIPTIPISGYAIPIRMQRAEYVDMDTGRVFLTIKAFHTSGGLLVDRLGLGLGQTTSCWPEDRTQVLNMVNIDQLLEQGETK